MRQFLVPIQNFQNNLLIEQFGQTYVQDPATLVEHLKCNWTGYNFFVFQYFYFLSQNYFGKYSKFYEQLAYVNRYKKRFSS